MTASRIRQGILLVALACSVNACACLRPDRAIRVATGTVAHDLCTETFVSGLDPDIAYDESISPRPGFGWVRWGLHYRVDREHRCVRASFLGTLVSRAVFRGAWGCVLDHGGVPIEQPSRVVPSRAPALLEEIAGPAPVETDNPRLKAVLDAEFSEPHDGPQRATKAVVILRDGKVIAERYAPGYGVDTPILGFSMSKSVTSALVGILVREARLSPSAPAPVPAWRKAGDPRGAITLEQLMRMTSGLDLDETGSGFDPSNRMFYDEEDMAGFAERADLEAQPGTHWAYSSASVQLVARIVRDRVGGTAEAVQQFAFDELFNPLGMEHMTMEMDATGTPVGAHYMVASARDWARFGQLYLQDGVVGSRRILPEGWVDFSARATLDTAYGAGWWTNRGSNAQAPQRVLDGVPHDAFFALGNLGQRIAVIPSERMLVVRLGRAQTPHFDLDAFAQLVSGSIAAVR